MRVCPECAHRVVPMDAALRRLFEGCDTSTASERLVAWDMRQRLSAVRIAARRGLLGLLRALCAVTGDLALPNNHLRYTVLEDTARYGTPAAARVLCHALVERGLKPMEHEPRQFGGSQPVMHAAGSRLDMVRMFCELPPEAGVHPGCCNGLVLASAASAGAVDLVRYLCDLPLERGVDPSAKGNAALREAAREGHTGVVVLLCQLPANRGVDPSVAMTIAARRGKLDVVTAMLALPEHCGVDPGANDNAALIAASRGGHVGIVRALLALPAKRGVDPGARNNIALRVAAMGGHTAIVRILCELPLARGVDPGADGNDALRLAARGGHGDVVQVLCSLPRSRGVDPDAQGHEALLQAAHAGSVPAVRTLCEHMLVYGCGRPHRVPTAAVHAAFADARYAVVRYLVLGLPGGERWCQQVAALFAEHEVESDVARAVRDEEMARQRSSWHMPRPLSVLRSFGECAHVVCEAARKQCLWHRRRSLLLLRSLVAAERGESRLSRAPPPGHMDKPRPVAASATLERSAGLISDDSDATATRPRKRARRLGTYSTPACYHLRTPQCNGMRSVLPTHPTCYWVP